MDDANLTEHRILEARQLFEQGRQEEALAAVNELDDSGELGGLVCFARGNVYLGMGQEALAYENYNRAVEKGFVNHRVIMNLASVSLRLGRSRQAELFCRQAHELDPTEIAPLEMICELRREAGDIDGALSIAEEMMQRHPSQFEGFRQALDLFLLQKRAEDALTLLTETELRFSAHPLYIYYRAFTLGSLGKLQDALEYLEAKESCFYENSAKPLYMGERTRLLLALGRRQEAEPLLRELFTANGDREAGFSLVDAALSRQDYNDVIALTDQLTEEKAEDAIYYMSLYLSGLARKLQSGPEAAQPAFERAAEAFGSLGSHAPTELLLTRASLYAELGRGPDAFADLDALSAQLAELQEQADEKEKAAPEKLSAVLDQIAALRTEIAALPALAEGPAQKNTASDGIADAFV